MARRLCVSSEAETSAQTGRPSTLATFAAFATFTIGAEPRGCVFLEMVCVSAMVFPDEKFSVRHPRGTGRFAARMPRERQQYEGEQSRHRFRGSFGSPVSC